jgi:hypothetical protein
MQRKEKDVNQKEKVDDGKFAVRIGRWTDDGSLNHLFHAIG